MGAFEPEKFFNLVFVNGCQETALSVILSWAKRSVSSIRAGTGLGEIIWEFINCYIYLFEILGAGIFYFKFDCRGYLHSIQSGSFSGFL